ncbi:AraC family transcriptional regulator [Paenibacillus sp. J5C_2022]|uniref:AraC family transcriptional regulator n=1 Tax=Paenibacillus sp. J5C2022 TaxID=2977129 RepID=UPI0021CFA9B9|nr:AraC family transcriptional regulator [Paenibacillus sp. J5C2022]MCU6708122.1 AraC family transcriptional regulator [Paenibacillus sp. J5C2022]
MKEDYRSTPPFADRLGGIHPNHHEVLYISEGKVQLNFISQIYVIEGPALILIPLNTYHKLVLISKNYSYFYWELEDKDSNLFPEFEICTIWNHLQLHMNESFTEQSMITRRIDYLSQILKSDWATEQQSLFHQMSLSDITTILALIRHVVQTYETQENKNKNKTLIHREAPAPAKDTIEMLVRWMEASYWEKITLQTLSDFVHLNPSYLIRMFKKYKGITPFQYLNDLRMKAATGYLSNSSMGVQEIVDKTGYQSIHYFSRVFKQKHGKSPIQWRMDRLGKTSEQ